MRTKSGTEQTCSPAVENTTLVTSLEYLNLTNDGSALLAHKHNTLRSAQHYHSSLHSVCIEQLPDVLRSIPLEKNCLLVNIRRLPTHYSASESYNKFKQETVVKWKKPTVHFHVILSVAASATAWNARALLSKENFSSTKK